jgi:hypothetical protein
MNRTSNTFSVLQATAAIVSFAIILWSLGLPSFRFAEAANVTTISDTLSTSEPSVVSDHTIVFTTPTGVAAGETIVITFPTSTFDLSTIGFEDIDLASTTGDYTLAAAASGETWGVATTSNTITLTSATAVLTANATVTIEIGANATFGGGSQTQIVNPVALGGGASYKIDVSAGNGADTGSTRVVILDAVVVTATVDTIFTFEVAGVAGGQDVNGTNTTGPTTATTIPFGTLVAGTASTAAQLLTVSTNAANGFVVTVTSDGQLNSITGADIDGFKDGAFTTTATAWTAPLGTLGSENTYGHWGLTSDDPTLTAGLSDLYGSALYVSASTTPVEVFRNDGATNGTGLGVGTTTVGYNVEISALQEAANDYTATLTYVATPVF